MGHSRVEEAEGHAHSRPDPGAVSPPPGVTVLQGPRHSHQDRVFCHPEPDHDCQP